MVSTGLIIGAVLVLGVIVYGVEEAAEEFAEATKTAGSAAGSAVTTGRAVSIAGFSIGAMWGEAIISMVMALPGLLTTWAAGAVGYLGFSGMVQFTAFQWLLLVLALSLALVAWKGD